MKETKQNKGKNGKGLHDGHRQRMREKFLHNGFDGMKEHEMLEMLLFYAIPRKNTNEIAHELIHEFGSLADVFEANYNDLLKINDISENSAVLIKMMLPLFNAYRKSPDTNKKTIKFSGASDCGEYLCKYFSCINNEIVVVLCIDVNGKLLDIEKVSDGDAASCYVSFRKIVETALKNPLTVSVIVSHNHPKGVALPSREDIVATDELCKSLKSMNINMADHIVVAGDKFVSMSSSAAFRDIFK